MVFFASLARIILTVALFPVLRCCCYLFIFIYTKPIPQGRHVLDAIARFEDASEYDGLLHNGDLSYACGQGWIHEEWGTLTEPLASVLPYMVTQGNHEYDHDTSAFPTSADRATWANGQYANDAGGDCGITYRKRFMMPPGTSSVASALSAPHVDAKPVKVGDTPAWYSVDIGHVHFVALTLETDFTNSSAQHAWISRDLAAVNRAHTPWIVVALHRHIFSAGEWAGGLIEKEQAELEPLFMQGTSFGS